MEEQWTWISILASTFLVGIQIKSSKVCFWKKEVLEILATSHNPGSKVVYYVNQSSRRRAWRAGERRGERRGFPDAAQNQFSILSSLVGLHEHMISLLPREMHSFIPDRNSCKQDLRLDDHLVSWIWICIMDLTLREQINQRSSISQDKIRPK